MKKFLLIFFLFAVIFNAQTENKCSDKSSAYDSTKAKLFGADDYGMKTYIMAFLKRGTNKDLDSTQRVQLQKAHLKNISRMAEEGKLVLAGPFYGDGDLRGIYIFNVDSIEEAKELTETDPAIKAGTLKMDLLKWYGSAALMEINELSKAIIKKSFDLD